MQNKNTMVHHDSQFSKMCFALRILQQMKLEVFCCVLRQHAWCTHTWDLIDGGIQSSTVSQKRLILFRFRFGSFSSFTCWLCWLQIFDRLTGHFKPHSFTYPGKEKEFSCSPQYFASLCVERSCFHFHFWRGARVSEGENTLTGVWTRNELCSTFASEKRCFMHTKQTKPKSIRESRLVFVSLEMVFHSGRLFVVLNMDAI